MEHTYDSLRTLAISAVTFPSLDAEYALTILQDAPEENGYCLAICELEHRNQCQNLIQDLSDVGFMDLDCSDLEDADAKILEEIGEEL